MDDSPFSRPAASKHDSMVSMGSPGAGQQQEFDPLTTTKVTSPFYQYNHDTPRGSSDSKPPPLPLKVNVSTYERDLESGNGNDSSTTLSPSISQEKQQAVQAHKRGKSSTSGVVTGSRGRSSVWGSRSQQCMTKPKQRRCLWWHQMSPYTRVLIKILIAVIMVGLVVGVAVGISVKVQGGVWKDSNTTAPIPSPGQHR